MTDKEKIDMAYKLLKKEIRKCKVVCYNCHTLINIRDSKKCQTFGH